MKEDVFARLRNPPVPVVFVVRPPTNPVAREFGQLHQYVVDRLPMCRLHSEALALCGELLGMWTLDTPPGEEREVRHAVTTIVAASGVCPAELIGLPDHITKHEVFREWIDTAHLMTHDVEDD